MDVRSVADEMVLLLGVRSGIVGDRQESSVTGTGEKALASLGA